MERGRESGCIILQPDFLSSVRGTSVAVRLQIGDRCFLKGHGEDEFGFVGLSRLEPTVGCTVADERPELSLHRKVSCCRKMSADGTVAHDLQARFAGTPKMGADWPVNRAKHSLT